jgi:hypothetical protein
MQVESGRFAVDQKAVVIVFFIFLFLYFVVAGTESYILTQKHFHAYFGTW